MRERDTSSRMVPGKREGTKGRSRVGLGEQGGGVGVQEKAWSIVLAGWR
jgi:hypothetical protein